MSAGCFQKFQEWLILPDSHSLRCSVFQLVFLGYCQTTVNSVFREALQAPRRKHHAAGKPPTSSVHPASKFMRSCEGVS
jgi:hypothetical protein